MGLFMHIDFYWCILRVLCFLLDKNTEISLMIIFNDTSILKRFVTFKHTMLNIVDSVYVSAIKL